MKKKILVLAILFGVSVDAVSKESRIRSLFDVVAPVLNTDPHPANREVGQIFYDNVAGLFKGVNRFGEIDVLTNVGGTGNLSKSSVEAPFSSGTSLVYDPATGFAPVIFPTEIYDLGSLYDSATGTFTAPTDGFYSLSTKVSAVVAVGAQYQAGDKARLAVFKNGTVLLNIVDEDAKTTINYMSMTIDIDYELVAGDTLQVVIIATRAADPSNPIPAYSGWATFKQIP
ncbi:MAG: hypothetical protein K2Q26_07030 [Bdellovibrionales bacterium]|nr:hypothetical protein [Bdellovibrionales bacterium]